jgi:hypothetical protein
MIIKLPLNLNSQTTLKAFCDYHNCDYDAYPDYGDAIEAYFEQGGLIDFNYLAINICNSTDLIDIYFDKDLIFLPTRHGDDVGTSVERSNYHWMSENYDFTGCDDAYGADEDTQAIQIVANITQADLQIFYDLIKRLDSYPILNDDHYSTQSLDDCENAWYNWQASEVETSLGLCPILSEALESSNLILRDIIGEYNLFDLVECVEDNCYFYWDLNTACFQAALKDALADYLTKSINRNLP